jgi:large subunit ribosomal protein L13
MTTTDTTTYVIDATNKRLGVVATEAARVLLGKDRPDFTKHITASVHVRIENASKLDISEKRATEIYQSFSGFPGGRRTETLGHLAGRRGYAEVVRRTVAGMLPTNKLKKPRLANLSVTE